MKIISLFLLIAFATNSLFGQTGKAEPVVLIETNHGNIKVKLYNQTPKHRDNFLKLVKENYYNGVLFHRVINQFMIQAGDPDSKNAAPGTMLGNGGPGYEIDAEIKPGLFHKKGALAAARQGDNVNPLKKSSGSQFYIVQGQIFTAEQLNAMEQKINGQKKQSLMVQYLNKPENKVLKNKVDSLNKAGDRNTLNAIGAEIEQKIAKDLSTDKLFKFTPEQRTIYSTVGGTPHLDDAYTVFGEVLEGLEIVDKIAVVKTDKNNRPEKDVVITKMSIIL